MVSTEGLVPITRAFLASYYDKYPFTPLSDDVSRLSQQIYAMATTDLLKDSPPAQGESSLIREAESEPPHKVDENMWKNREQIEEILFLLEAPHWPRALQQRSTVEDEELASVLGRLQDKFKSTLQTLESFQARNSEFVFNTVMTYMPQDFRGTIIRQQKERSERNKQAVIDALVSSGGSIHDKYALLWKQQMDRRKQLAELGSATGVYKTMMKYLVGVPEVLMDFVRQINDDQGPMEEQRQRYGPPLYSLTRMVYSIRLFLTLLWGRLETQKLQKDQISVLEEAANVYTSELERFIKFIGEVFTNSPFLITAEDAGALTARKNDEYKEISVPAGETHEKQVKLVQDENMLLENILRTLLQELVSAAVESGEAIMQYGQSIVDEDARPGQIRRLLDIVLYLCEKEHVEGGMIFQLLEDLTEMSTMRNCKDVFGYIESKQDILGKPEGTCYAENMQSAASSSIEVENERNRHLTVVRLLDQLILSQSDSLITAARQLPPHELTSDFILLLELARNLAPSQQGIEDATQTFIKLSQLIHGISRSSFLEINSTLWTLVLDSFKRIVQIFLGKAKTEGAFIGGVAVIKPTKQCLESLRLLFSLYQAATSLSENGHSTYFSDNCSVSGECV